MPYFGILVQIGLMAKKVNGLDSPYNSRNYLVDRTTRGIPTSTNRFRDRDDCPDDRNEISKRWARTYFRPNMNALKTESDGGMITCMYVIHTYPHKSQN